MRIEITCRHDSFPPPLLEYAEKQLNHIERLGEEFEKGEVVFDHEGGDTTCDVIIHRKRGEPFVASDKATDGRAAVDSVVGKLERQYLKSKEKQSAKDRRPH
jgi:ribosomal subunit interface protein